jgi:hypothetical protein
MTEITINRTPIFIAGITFFVELGSKLPWPLSGAVSAGMATAIWLAFMDELFIKNEKPVPELNPIPEPIPDVTETKITPKKKWWFWGGGIKTE